MGWRFWKRWSKPVRTAEDLRVAIQHDLRKASLELGGPELRKNPEAITTLVEDACERFDRYVRLCERSGQATDTSDATFEKGYREIFDESLRVVMKYQVRQQLVETYREVALQFGISPSDSIVQRAADAAADDFELGGDMQAAAAVGLEMLALRSASSGL